MRIFIHSHPCTNVYPQQTENTHNWIRSWWRVASSIQMRKKIKVFLFEKLSVWAWDECLHFFESNEFTVSVLICLLAREKLCKGKDESSNAEESQLGFMSTQTPVQKHIIMHTNIHEQTGHPSVWTIHRLVMRCPIQPTTIQLFMHTVEPLRTHAANTHRPKNAWNHKNPLVCRAFHRWEMETTESSQLGPEEKKILPLVVSMETVPLFTLRGG